MVIMKLPSLLKIYRVVYLHECVKDDPTGQAIKKCDKDGSLCVFISRMIPKNDKSRFYAFGRVFKEPLHKEWKLESKDQTILLENQMIFKLRMFKELLSW